MEIVGILVRDRDREGEAHFHVQLLWRYAMWFLIHCSSSLLVYIVVVEYVLLLVSIGSIHCLLPPIYTLYRGQLAMLSTSGSQRSNEGWIVVGATCLELLVGCYTRPAAISEHPQGLGKGIRAIHTEWS